jgi:Negative regulator of sigma E activity
VALFVLATGFVAAADSSDEAQTWLKRMTEALTRLDYEGTFIYLHDAKLNAMRIVHIVDEKGEHERLVSLNGAAREVIRSNDAVTCFLPDDKSVVVEQRLATAPFPSSLTIRAEALGRYYEFMLSGRDRVAGRAARIVALKPKDLYRYGYRLWLDEQSGMLLKSQLLDENGFPIEQFMFTSIEISGNIPRSALKPASSGEGFTWYWYNHESAAPGVREGRLRITALPKGFSLSQHKQRSLPRSADPVDHIVLTDGVATISVFVEKPATGKALFEGTSRRGAVNVFGTVIGDRQVTVVGEVPQATVRLIGRSVQWLGD